MVYHILRDGRQVDDITGYVLKIEENKQLYSLIESINSRPIERKAKINV